ncbi:hypothetical protein [Rhizobium leguminosarum]|uniref:hypothetical protein n=1 Tax=Rhizobium leguminosarum TaxID=384 RepID=UPI0005673CEE|nr:hypothetical protein [Rhizobium leguminosarum]
MGTGINELEELIFNDLTTFLEGNDRHLRAVNDASKIIAHAKLLQPGNLPAEIPAELKIDPPALADFPK